MHRTPTKTMKTLNNNNFLGQCPKCIEEDDPMMAECTMCKRKFHVTCVELTDDEHRSLKFNCSSCLNELGAAGRTIPTRKFARQMQEKQSDSNLVLTPSRTVVKSKKPLPISSPKKTVSVSSKASHKSNASQRKLLEKRLSILQEEKELLKQLETMTVIDDEESDSETVSEDRNASDDSNDDFHSVPNEQTSRPTTTRNQNRARRSEANQGEPVPSAYQLAARNAFTKDLPQFHGYSDEWPVFISTYKRTTRICGFSDDENITRLERALKGEARMRVASQLGYPSCVDNIIKTLEMIYGRPEHIIKSQIEKIRQLPTVKIEKIETLVNLSVAVDNVCATMEASNLSTYINNPLLMEELVDKLPNDYKINWSRFVARVPTKNLITFQEWLHDEAEHACKVTNLTATKPENDRKYAKGRINAHFDTKSKTTFSSDSERKCLSCNGNCSKISNCSKFLNLNTSERWNIVKELKLCRSCLKKHPMKYPFKCRNAVMCDVDGCKAKHNRLLHNEKKEENDGSKNDGKDTNKNSPSIKEEFCGSHISNSTKPHFRYLPVKLTNENDSISVEVIAFLDEGSSGTYLNENLAKKLKLSGLKNPLHLKWTNDQIRVEPNSMKTSCKITGIYNGALTHVLKNIQTVESLNLPKQDLNYDVCSKEYSYLGHLPVQSYANAKPEILIGLNNWRYAVPLKTREGDIHQPIAIKCRLGWTIYAANDHKTTDEEHCNFHYVKKEDDCDENLNFMMRNFFSIDSLGVKIPKYDVASKEEQRARAIMEETTKRVENRFETGLLWKYDDLKLPNSRPMAIQRLKALEYRLRRDSQLRENVQKQIGEYLKKNYIRKLSREELQVNHQHIWYLPIFPTTNPNKPEKVRIVWDAKAVTDGISLNAALLKGPDQLSSLYGILIRFREGKIGIAGDIAEMFHQVNIIPKDQHSQRFLWRNCDQNKPPDEYVMNVMTFGATCSPASAQFVKNMNAAAFKDEFPRAYHSIVYNHYVDDMLDSCDSVQEALTLIEQVKKIHHNGGFTIRKWKSNSDNVMNSLENTQVDQQEAQNLNMDTEQSFEKVLGLWWNVKADSFTYLLRFNKGNADVLKGSKRPTKREVLRVLMSIFDPLGLIAHYLSYLKCLMQEIWSSRIDWDEEINDQHFQKWLRWVKLLPTIERLNIPRCYTADFDTLQNVNKQLHVFVDASKQNCVAVAYLRLETSGKVKCCLVGAKTKVAPLKLMSIPKLELVAAQIGARLSVNLSESFSFKTNATFWTDSKTVMNWINSDAKAINGQFIAFRTAEIQELTSIQSWKYVPSKMNVADEATKWNKNPELDMSGRWFHGPEFLYLPENQWPERKFVKERDENVQKFVGFHAKQSDLFDFEKFANYDKLLKTVAFVHRYIDILKCRVRKIELPTGIVSAKELRTAETTIFREVQMSSFKDEIDKLKCSKPVNSQSTLRQLNPFLDENGIIRSKGRYQRTSYLIMLPRNHVVTYKVVQRCHEKYLHQYHETVINQLRQRYHIPKLRQVLKSVINHCQMCKNRNAKPNPPMMSVLPSCRLATFEPAFIHTGVDYFGPINVKIGRRQEKRWGCLFTCLTTRGIHLEVAHKLDTDAFILCYRNFLNRRPPVQHIYSDNGTNFVGAEKVLKQALKEINSGEIASHFINTDLEWHFNPPASPHMGGAWERLVKSVKNTLYAIEPFHTFTDPLLNSYLIEVEDIINSRPLTYLPLDTEESEALTPNHFIKGTGLVPPIGSIRDDVKFMKSNWQNAQLLKQRFWKRWIKEYLPTLNRREKWCIPSSPLKVNDIVIIIDPTATRNTWKKGRVVKINMGKDGQVRSADVQTKSGVFTRPAVNLAKLDVTTAQEERM